MADESGWSRNWALAPPFISPCQNINEYRRGRNLPLYPQPDRFGAADGSLAAGLGEPPQEVGRKRDCGAAVYRHRCGPEHHAGIGAPPPASCRYATIDETVLLRIEI